MLIVVTFPGYEKYHLKASKKHPEQTPDEGLRFEDKLLALAVRE
jgi:hypothetical protein